MLHQLLVELLFEEVQSAKKPLYRPQYLKPITAISTNFRIHGANNLVSQFKLKLQKSHTQMVLPTVAESLTLTKPSPRKPWVLAHYSLRLLTRIT